MIRDLSLQSTTTEQRFNRSLDHSQCATQPPCSLGVGNFQKDILEDVRSFILFLLGFHTNSYEGGGGGGVGSMGRLAVLTIFLFFKTIFSLYYVWNMERMQ